MRRILALAAAAASLTAAVACGGGQDPTLDDASSGSSTTASSVVAGEVPPGSETTVAPTGETTAPGADTTPAETVPSVVEVPAPPPGTPTYAPPAPGAYTYRTVAGSGPPETVTTIERLSDTDIRQTGAGFTGGQQIAELSFRGNEVHLTRLVVTIPLLGTKEFLGDVLFTPIPPAGNWSWSLTSTDRSVTVNQTAAADPDTDTVTSTLHVPQFNQTVTLVITYDLELRMPRRIQSSGAGQNNTSELVGFQPA